MLYRDCRETGGEETDIFVVDLEAVCVNVCACVSNEVFRATRRI